MGLLDFIRNRNRSKDTDSDLDPKVHGHKNWKGVFSEIREDEVAGRLRRETGREPECRNSKTIPRTKPSWER